MIVKSKFLLTQLRDVLSLLMLIWLVGFLLVQGKTFQLELILLCCSLLLISHLFSVKLKLWKNQQCWKDIKLFL